MQKIKSAGVVVPVFSRDGVDILYIHVPKTGGTSIEYFFEQNGFAVSYLDRGISQPSLNRVRRCSPQHMTRQQLQAIFNPGQFKYVFMTVRNPYARLFSTFQMRHGKHAEMDFDGWARGTLQQLANSPFIFDNHIRPQVDFFLPRAEVFKQEDGYGPGWIRRMSERTGFDLPRREVWRQMVSDKVDRAPMSDASKALIAQVYAEDFSKFGYEK